MSASAITVALWFAFVATIGLLVRTRRERARWEHGATFWKGKYDELMADVVASDREVKQP